MLFCASLLLLYCGSVRAWDSNYAGRGNGTLPISRQFEWDEGISNAERISTAVTTLLTDASSTNALPNGACFRDLEHIRTSWANLQKCNNTACAGPYVWIRDLLDAQGRRPSGLKSGNRMWFGAYRQCLSINVMDKQNGVIFKAQYYKTLVPTQSIGVISLGICLPVTCSTEEIRHAVSKISRVNMERFSIETITDSRTLPISGVLAIIGCVILLAVMTMATLLDLTLFRRYVRKHGPDGPWMVLQKELHKSEVKGAGEKLFLSFSVLTNGVQLLSIDEIPGQIACLEGIRWLTCQWVMSSHGYSALFHADNPYFDAQKSGNILSLMFALAYYATDTFFVIGGVVLSYSWLKKYSNSGAKTKFKKPSFWINFYVRRYIRLTVPYAFFLWMHQEFFYYLSDGPLWRSAKDDVCRKVFWHHIFYVTNFLSHEENQCLMHTWYMTTSFQLHVVSPLILVPLTLYPQIGYFLAGALVIFDTVARGMVYGLNNFAPFLYGLSDRYNQSDGPKWAAYASPVYRLGPYLIGVLSGAILFEKMKRPTRHSRNFQRACWLLAAFVVLFAALPFGVEYLPPLANGIYSGVMKNMWALSVCWVVYACVTGNAVFVNKLLSWKIFAPLSRLTYCVYLLHILVYIYMQTAGESARHFEGTKSVVLDSAACITITLPLAAILHLAVELPAAELANYCHIREY